MKTIVFEVVLGLIFIYLLYSIFITIVAEMTATWFGMRARLLRQGITHMLTDLGDKNKYGSENRFLSKIKRFFLIEPQDFRRSKAGEFYNQPSIKYLSQRTDKIPVWYNPFSWFEKGRPSYISKEAFSSTLINMLRNKGRGVHDWGKIGFSVVNNTLHFDPNTSKQLTAIYEDADDDMEAFIQKLEVWYEEMMDRVNGWFKRKIHFLIFWLGFLVAVILHVDTFDIVNTLSKDPTLRNQFVELAVAAADEGSNMSNMVNQLDSNFVEEELFKTFSQIAKEVDKTSILLGNGWDFEARKIKIPLNIKGDTLDQIKFKIKQIQDTSDSLKVLYEKLKIPNVKFYHTDSLLDIILAYKKLKNSLVNNVNSLAQTTFSEIIKLEPVSKNGKVQYTLTGTIQPGLFQKTVDIIKQLNPFRKKFWGFCITALAICLGAPFWFDLLKKLVALRGTGINPLEKEKENTWEKVTKTEKPQMGTTIKNADKIDIVIAANRGKWLAVPGVISVNKVFLKKEDGTKKYGIEILYKEGFDMSVIKVEDASGIEVIKKTGLVADYQTLEIKGAMTGTIAGLLYNKDTNKNCVLTCAHVLSLSGHSIVYRGEGNISGVGKINKMIWSNLFDAGVVDLINQDKPYLKIPPPYLVTDEDTERETTVYIQKSDGSNFGVNTENIKIIHADYDFVFKDVHTHKKYKLYNLITIAQKKDGKNSMPTKPGDSGALVKFKGEERKDDKSVGIIIGGFENDEGIGLSFVLPMTKILETLNLEIIKT